MSGKVIAITSVVQGNGAKYLATNLGYELSKKFKNENKVLLIDFDFDNPCLAYEYVKNDDIHGIDNIVSSISSGGLTEELFKDNIISTPIGVDVLRGTKFPEKFKSFTKDIIETILNYSKKLYDYIFVVITNKANNAGTVYTLFNADDLIVVARNNYSNMIRIEKIMKMLLQYYRQEKSIKMVYNFKNHNAKSDINSKLSGVNIEVVGILDYDEKSIDNIDLEKRMSVFGSKSINNKTFTKIINQLLQQ